MLKQEMARVNGDILGISELKWTGMGGVTIEQESDMTEGYFFLSVLSISSGWGRPREALLLT